MLSEWDTKKLVDRILTARKKSRPKVSKHSVSKKTGRKTIVKVHKGVAKRFFRLDDYGKEWAYWGSARNVDVFHFDEPFNGSKGDPSLAASRCASSIVWIDCESKRAFYKKLNGRWVDDADPSGNLLEFLT